MSSRLKSKYWQSESEDSFEDSFDDYVSWRHQQALAIAQGVLPPKVVDGKADGEPKDGFPYKQTDRSLPIVVKKDDLPPPNTNANSNRVDAVVGTKVETAAPATKEPEVAAPVVTIAPPAKKDPVVVAPIARFETATKALDVSNTRGDPVSPRTTAKTKFTPNEMKDMNNGSLKCSRCQLRFSLFQGPDKCGSCGQTVCTKCSLHVANAPHLLKTSVDPTVCQSCWPAFKGSLEAGPRESREALEREVNAGDAYFALPRENRVGALENEALVRKNNNETTAQYFDRNPCCICKRGYDLFRCPGSCTSCQRHMCSSAACSKRVENLAARPMTCRECWPGYKKQLEVMLKDPHLPRELEESIVVETCLGVKFLEDLRPAQTRVNIQHETNTALSQADSILTLRRARQLNAVEGNEGAAASSSAASLTASSNKPLPPSNKPPPPPAESEDDEDVVVVAAAAAAAPSKKEELVQTPKMDSTRAVVPQTAFKEEEKLKPAVVSVSKELIYDPVQVQLRKEEEAVSVVKVAPVLKTEESVEVQVVTPTKLADLTRQSSDDSLTSTEEEKAKTAPPALPPRPGCKVCQEEFDLFRREKQCSECSGAVCNQCVGFFRLRSLQDSKPRYICFNCLPSVRGRVVDPRFKGAELVRATREAAAVDLLLAGNLHQHYVSTDFSPAELADMKNGTLRCARSKDVFDFSRPPRRCSDCNSVCSSRDCRNFDWVARILQRPQPSTLCRACWPAARAELVAKALEDPSTVNRVVDEISVGDAFFALDRQKDFPDAPNVERGQRCHTCSKKFTLFRIPQTCCNCKELVCTGVACSGKFLVPNVSKVAPSVVCSGCLSKVSISRPRPGQLTSQQDNSLSPNQGTAVLGGATCKESGRGFSFWERPQECGSCGNMVHITACEIVGSNIVCRSCAHPKPKHTFVEEAASSNTTLNSSANDAEDVESVSETDTTSVEFVEATQKSINAAATQAKSTPADDSRVLNATVGGNDSSIAAKGEDEKSEEVSTSSTAEDEADKVLTGTVDSSVVVAANATVAAPAADEAPPTGQPEGYKLPKWYPYMKHLTAPTTFVRLTKAETLALVNASDAKTQAQVVAGDMNSLLAKLDAAIKEQGGVVFIKIETRSPKDVLQSPAMMDRLRNLVRPTMRAPSGVPTMLEKVALANADTIAFVKGIRQLFKVTSGQEGVDMLKMSERIKNDLIYFANEENGSTLCVRRWRDVDAAREFRAFIHKKRLTACSQYCYYQCFPELVSDKKQLGQKIQDFFQQRVLPNFPYEDAIVDFHVTDTDIEIIELSPFAASTGACMFSWKEDTDKNVLENGPFELRILTEPKENPYDCLPSKWRLWFESERGFSLRKDGNVVNNNNNNNSVAPTKQGDAAPTEKKKFIDIKKWTFGRKKGKEEKEKKEQEEKKGGK